ncbi:integral membrane protein [Plectosphaerella plurivora]|uniref:Integral membrane protein n=1 Tax=Plectosphaerella plurivora TaxID=936078 RepID=A0A9P8VG76_9PEZI|nr:integral membrane protein [Plectosphaerella plurivora]
MSDSDVAPVDQPPVINYVIGFLLVGVAWGLTTPFIRRAAKNHNPPEHPILETDAIKRSWLKSKLYGAFFGVVDLLRNPRYAAPLLINLTGSVWFFLLIGKAELSLTVPIVNTLAFLFTVLGEWWVEKKVISKETAFGMFLSLVGIGLCVQSKNT